MFKKELIISVLVAFLFMGFIGTAFAEQNNDTSILGSDQFSFDANNSMNSEAAINHDYNQEHLAVVGTEAGDWKIDFAAPESKAEMAANNYNYNQQHLALVGTESGDWKFNNTAPETTGNEEQTTATNKQGSMCSGC